IIGLACFDFATQNLTLSYEHIFGKAGKLGIRIPVSINLLGTSTQENNSLNRAPSLFYSGIDLNYYPMGMRTAGFFLGPVIRVGQTRSLDYYGIGPDIALRRSSYISFLINGGVYFNPVKELNFQLVFGLGS